MIAFFVIKLIIIIYLSLSTVFIIIIKYFFPNKSKSTKPHTYIIYKENHCIPDHPPAVCAVYCVMQCVVASSGGGGLYWHCDLIPFLSPDQWSVNNERSRSGGRGNGAWDYCDIYWHSCFSYHSSVASPRRPVAQSTSLLSAQTGIISDT